jgi:hypothetical protein
MTNVNKLAKLTAYPAHPGDALGDRGWGIDALRRSRLVRNAKPPHIGGRTVSCLAHAGLVFSIVAVGFCPPARADDIKTVKLGTTVDVNIATRFITAGKKGLPAPPKSRAVIAILLIGTKCRVFPERS